MKLRLFFLFLLTTSFLSFSQTTLRSGTNNNRYNLANINNLLRIKYDSIGDRGEIKGSPYYNVNFLAGTVYKNNEVYKKDVLLRYNAYEDIVEIKESSDVKTANVLSKTNGQTVRINNSFFVTMIEPNSKKLEYFQVLFIGEKINLFKKWRKVFNASQQANTGMTRDVPAIYKDSPIYFRMDADFNFIEIPKSKKKFLKSLGDKSESVKKYMKEKRLKLSKDEDFIKIIKFYETL